MTIADASLTLLEKGLADLPLTFTPSMQARFVDYLALLGKWNAVHNLSAIRNIEEQIRLHILDCLAILPLIDKDWGTVADIGSGAGLPGAMFAIARPDWQLKLVESNSKKIAFLREVKRTLRLDNVEVIGLRAEKWFPGNPIGLITSRAVATIDDFLTITAHLGNDMTVWGLMKAHDGEPCHTVGFTKIAVKAVSVPLLDAPRLWVEIQREKISE